MKTLRYTSKKANEYITGFKRSQKTTLRDCYGTYSWDKQLAYNWCKEQCFKEGGEMLRIISWNTFQFTCAWRVKNSDGKYDLRVETAKSSYIIKDFAII